MPGEPYRIQENTGNPVHPSIEAVLTLALDRAADPRPSDHQDSHFDRYVQDAVEHAGEAAVKQAIRLSLTEGLTHRMAGRKAFGDDNYVYGINVGVAAIAYLRELNSNSLSDL
ncbi:hypothetical protein [Halorubrum sp. AJ67]|uniref:hypothetical protein n=1 Tax=Halorubrum sp. AJ67 TaxID=1173487 RepID=UPI0003DCFE3F|nr:hypothetical protein [Halorubrum sp. AJ67]CDK40654.1 uncharacterized protein BN903_36 [Halorubrum sp. AJ67]